MQFWELIDVVFREPCSDSCRRDELAGPKRYEVLYGTFGLGEFMRWDFLCLPKSVYISS